MKTIYSHFHKNTSFRFIYQQSGPGNTPPAKVESKLEGAIDDNEDVESAITKTENNCTQLFKTIGNAYESQQKVIEHGLDPKGALIEKTEEGYIVDGVEYTKDSVKGNDLYYAGPLYLGSGAFKIPLKGSFNLASYNEHTRKGLEELNDNFLAQTEKFSENNQTMSADLAAKTKEKNDQEEDKIKNESDRYVEEALEEIFLKKEKSK